MEVLLKWEQFPDLVIKTVELKGEFKQGVQYAISEGFRLQRSDEFTVFKEEYGASEQLLFAQGI